MIAGKDVNKEIENFWVSALDEKLKNIEAIKAGMKASKVSRDKIKSDNLYLKELLKRENKIKDRSNRLLVLNCKSTSVYNGYPAYEVKFNNEENPDKDGLFLNIKGLGKRLDKGYNSVYGILVIYNPQKKTSDTMYELVIYNSKLFTIDLFIKSMQVLEYDPALINDIRVVKLDPVDTRSYKLNDDESKIFYANTFLVADDDEDLNQYQLYRYLDKIEKVS